MGEERRLRKASSWSVSVTDRIDIFIWAYGVRETWLLLEQEKIELWNKSQFVENKLCNML